MNIALIVMWAADGWCGTPWPHHPHPVPDPWWWRVLGLVGGVAGGWLFSVAFPIGNTDLAIYAAVSSLGAFVGGAVVHSFAGMAGAGGAAAR